MARLRMALAHEFDIEGELGHGGMAAVFRARERALNRRVAIKVMAPGLLHGDGMVDRFRQEAITVANLQHANIVAIHGVRAVEDLQLFVMQYVPGRSLDRVLRDEGALSLAAVRTIVYHVGSALDYAHRRGVIHRDIKPANILLDADGDPVVTDFGIAKVTETPGYTQVGMIVGTPTYMSPEQCMGFEVGPASDQYALGLVAYEMLTGRPPFVGTGMTMMRAHIDQPPPPLATSRADLPPEIESAILKMLAKNPADRFADLAEAIVAFGAEPLGALGPVRSEMAALAAPTEDETSLADIVRAPRSPAPGSVPVPRPRSATPAPPSAPTPQKSTAAPAASPPPSIAPVGRASAPIVDVVIDGAPAALVVGTTASLRVIARTSRGVPTDGAVSPAWQSSDPGIATVSSDGEVTGRSVGDVTITANCDGIRGSASIAIVRTRAHSVVVAPPPSPLRVGDRPPLIATVYDADGSRIRRPVSWRSTDPRVAFVDTAGRLVAQSEGWAIVTAQADGVDGHCEVVVRSQIVPVSAHGRAESRRLALRWWGLLLLLGGVVALGWVLLAR